ncbi:MAG: transcription termination/antitermination factor NusG [Sphingobacteriales bacterium]|jgi:transcriptional antiterminator NusG|nr:transcription termination/antitermination factor NusG [Sphingobacteriales bacterium]MBP9141533.1 transcription termination/antitermination factor NusG [Chitinophagales bacterium]MDA0198394.1 transcription termination/antitermination protein NusG [Bacteroidota bacterium]MBK6891084.1 transcription termination/antitermination factor NusG [Sphingobacteriales bacterium]MBK7527089.1 transcription termination/antitermination factor NusG [Sphingobacteriales bacterium]
MEDNTTHVKEHDSLLNEQSSDTKWYVLRVISGKERKVREYIELEVKRSKWEDIIKQVVTPTEKVYQIKNGKKTIKERNFYPGYMLVEAVEKKLNSDIVSTITAITGVISFLGKDTPVPLRKAEINRILGKVDEMEESGETVSVEPFLIGETVKIIDGPFNDFNGVIEEINNEKKKLKVIVKIFGRRTPVELNFIQVEKQA